MKHHRSIVSAFVLAPLLAAAARAQAGLPPNFSVTQVGTNWIQPTGLTFAPDGRAFVWEKAGFVWTVENGVKSSSPIIDIHDEVGNWRDYGCHGFALDPNFMTNGYVYLLYVVDYEHLNYAGTPQYDPNADIYFHDTISRVTRYTLNAFDGFHSVDYASRRVLIGESKSTGIAICHQSHGPGTLVFGEDGTLLVSHGDAASYDIVDHGGPIPGSSNTALADGIIRPKEDIGAYRAQLVDCHNGKILRIDPATGDGVPSNPFYDPLAPRAPRSRVWALGFRNPFRMTIVPGTGSSNPAAARPGTLLVGDVGWNSREEFSICNAPAMNFGWPLYEGLEAQPGYMGYGVLNQDAPNPLGNMSGCARLLFFQDLLVQETLGTPSWPNPCDASQQLPASVPHFMHTRPWIEYGHGGSTRAKAWNGNDAAAILLGAPGCPIQGLPFGGNAAIGGAWYNGTQFPPEYQHTLFCADYPTSWIKNVLFDASGRPTAINDFVPVGQAGHPVCLAVDPVVGSLWFLSYAENSGTSYVSRIDHVQNAPPIAVASESALYGPTPLAEQFTGSASNDPEGGALTYRWDFGDGTFSSQANPVHVYDNLVDISAQGTIIAKVFTLNPPHPLGNGNQDPNVIRDGDMPPVGSNAPLRQYDTFHNGDQGGSDWIGYLFPVQHEFHAVLFQEGQHYSNGGWFDSMHVQYSQDGNNWTNVAAQVVTPTYAAGNASSFTSYSISFNPVSARAIRLQGNPGGASAFISVGELRPLSLEQNPVPQRRDVTLTVTDPLGLASSAQLIVSLNNTPPVVQITSPLDGGFYPLTGNTIVPLTAQVSDAEQGPGGLACAWQTILHHNEHTHPEPIDSNCTSTTTLSPVGCDGNLYFYEISLTVTDSAGLSTHVSSFLHPDCCQGGPAPATYCVGKLSSQGCTPSIAFTGTPSASSHGAFRISAANVVSHKSGLLFYGMGAANTPFQGATLCVAPPLTRTPIQDSGGNTGPVDCSGSLSIDFNALVQSGIDPRLAPGRAVYAQWYYRDPLDPAGFGTGLSNALSFAICP